MGDGSGMELLVLSEEEPLKMSREEEAELKRLKEKDWRCRAKSGGNR